MRRIIFLASPVVLLLGANNAQAHLVNSGFGPFYDGLAHPFVTPVDLLVVIALTLLAGLRGAQCGRRVLFALPLAWLAGMTAATVLPVPAPPLWLGGVFTIAFGALVAADRSLPVNWVTGLAAGAGAVQGFGNGHELVTANGGLLAMTGILCALFVIAALAAGQVATLRAQSARVATRVAGSWIAAIGLLLLGWTLRGGR